MKQHRFGVSCVQHRLDFTFIYELTNRLQIPSINKHDRQSIYFDRLCFGKANTRRHDHRRKMRSLFIKSISIKWSVRPVVDEIYSDTVSFKGAQLMSV